MGRSVTGASSATAGLAASRTGRSGRRLRAWAPAIVAGLIVVGAMGARLWQLHRRDAAEARAIGALRAAGGRVDVVTGGWDSITGIKRYTVDFVGVRVDDEALRPLEDLGRLPQVLLGNCGLTDAGLAHLAGRPDVEHLLLADDPAAGPEKPRNRITDAGLRHVAGMRKLLSLNLDGDAITDEGLRHLTDLPSLAILQMNGCRIAGPGLAHLRGLPRLESLWLDGNPIDDEGLKAVGEIKGLTFLSLAGTSVTDAGLKHLYGLKRLRQVLLDVSRFSPKAITELRRALPDLEVVARSLPPPGLRPAAPPASGDLGHE